MTEFEPILLKKLIYNGEYFAKVMPILDNEYFVDIGNQELFKLVKNHYGTYRQVPSLTELVASVKNVSNSEIRSSIIDSLKSVSKTDEVLNVEFMLAETVNWVKDALYLKALQIGSDGLMKKDDNLKMKAQEIMELRSKISVDSDLGLDFDNIDDMIAYYSERNIGILTQHKQLNKRLGPGFLPGTLSVILAASGVGKSLLMTDLISGLIKKNKNILLVSLEMSDKEIMKRVHANAMNLPINSLIDLSKTEGELARIKAGDEDTPGRSIINKEDILNAYNKIKASGNCGKFFVKDYPTGSFSALMLEQLVESYKIEKNIKFDIIFVDYIGIMKSDLVSPSAGLYSYVKSISEEVRATAKKLNLAITSASQLNRGATNNVEDADNSNTSDSMGTVMTADFMLFLLQNEEMKERNEIVCKTTKNRFGGITDTWMMNVDYEHMRFNDMIIQNAGHDISNIEPIGNGTSVVDDFGIVTSEKLTVASDYADQEIKDIYREDIEKIKKANNENKVEPNPFKQDLDKLYNDLGI